MENRFKRLRHEDDLCLHRIYTMDELAEKLQISKATISHLEASDDYDARVSIMKQYKKFFPDVSYDYLLGAKNTKSNDYGDLETSLPLGDQFYKTLKALFTFQNYDDEMDPDMKQACIDLETEMQKRVEDMLTILFNDSNRLYHFLSDTYESLFKIYLLENPASEKDRYFDTNDKLAFEWYQFTQTTMEFFKGLVYEELQPALEHTRQLAIKRQEELENAQKAKTKSILNSIGVSEDNLPWD